MENDHAGEKIYEFEGFRLDAGEQELKRGAEKITLTPKAVELLTILVKRRGQIVTREEILNNLWRDTFVDESNLTVTVSMLRRAFDVRANDKQFIETIPKRGYRFNAEVRELNTELIVERQTQTRIKIQEMVNVSDTQTQIAALSRKVHQNTFVSAAVAVFLIAAFGGILGWRSFTGGKSQSLFALGAQTTRTIAVLPLDLGQSNPNNMKRANGLTESVAEEIGGFAQVLPFETVRSENANHQNFLLVGRKLEADAVLIGTLFEHPTDIYLRFHLVSTGDGAILWANTYRVSPAEISLLIESVAQNTANNLPKIAAPETYRQKAQIYTADEDAYALYLQGRFIWRARDDIWQKDLPLARNYFEEALRRDANFALPLVGLADFEKTDSFDSDERRRGEEHLRRALELAPDFADAHAAKGFTLMVHHWNWQEAEREFQTALQLDSQCVNASQWYALLLELEGQYTEAFDKITLARQLSPFSITIEKDWAEIHYLQRNYSSAIKIAENVNFKVPDVAGTILGDAFWQRGNFSQALDYLALTAGGVFKLEDYKEALEKEGANGVARLMSERFGSDKKYDLWASYWQAQWLASTGEREKALDLLERAASEHHFFIVWAKANPFFDNLRAEPRFTEILRKINLEP